VNVPRFCRGKRKKKKKKKRKRERERENSWLRKCKCRVVGPGGWSSSPRSSHSPRTTFISITKRFIICRYLRRRAPRARRDLTKRFLRFPTFELFQMECSKSFCNDAKLRVRAKSIAANKQFTISQLAAIGRNWIRLRNVRLFIDLIKHPGLGKKLILDLPPDDLSRPKL